MREIVDPILGFVSVPRLAGVSRSGGAFFSVTVIEALASKTWRVNLDGRSLVVTSDLALQPGQVLKLRFAAQQGASLLFQVALPSAESPPPSRVLDPLMVAFLSRGLPLVSERLAAWNRWLSQTPHPSDREGWAAALESRGAGPQDLLTDGLTPWLNWQSALEKGRSDPPPADDYWDQWNQKKTTGGDPWLVVPLRWEFEGRVDGGLLQARWNPQIQAVDRWHLTAAPAQTPFRLEAEVRPGALDLIWRFFDPLKQTQWKVWVEAQGPDLFAGSGLAVTLTVQGPPKKPETMNWRGVDVEA